MNTWFVNIQIQLNLDVEILILSPGTGNLPEYLVPKGDRTDKPSGYKLGRLKKKTSVTQKLENKGKMTRQTKVTLTTKRTKQCVLTAVDLR